MQCLERLFAVLEKGIDKGLWLNIGRFHTRGVGETFNFLAFATSIWIIRIIQAESARRANVARIVTRTTCTVRSCKGRITDLVGRCSALVGVIARSLSRHDEQVFGLQLV